MELFKANAQWAKRPDDERFPTLQALYDATKAYAQSAREATVPYDTLRTEAIEGDVQVVGKKNEPAKLTHWSFGQLCARVGAPASYLRGLPATLAVQNLNHGLKRVTAEDNDRNAKLLFHTNGGLLMRAVTSDIYARIWNYEIAERLLGLQQYGWEPATPDTNFAPTLGRNLTPGEMKQTALYASDHDLFAFVRNDQYGIRTRPGGEITGRRGVIVENSEVGDSALKLTRFIYDYMCGNHIIWGASDVIELSVRHVGDPAERLAKWQANISQIIRDSMNASGREEEEKIVRARNVKIGDTKEEVLDRLFGLRNLGLSRKALTAGYDAVVPSEDGDPRSPWGMVQGLTRYSQTVPYADTRTEIDRSAGKILAIDF